MRYGTAVAFRAALEQRLRERALATGLPLDVLRKRVAFERFLARLVQVAPDDWRLKGALALEFRLKDHARFTRDVDLVHRGDEEQAEESLRAAARQDLGDFLVFEVSRTGTLQSEESGERQVFRYRLRMTLAGRLFEEVRLDVGFLDPLGWEPETLRGSDLLTFAEIAPVEVPSLPLPQHVAEKVHALTRVYREAQPSSRVKDLVDVVLIAAFSSMDAAMVHSALEATFRARGTHPMPEALAEPPEHWSRPYLKMAQQVGLEGDVMAGHSRASRFIDPVLRGRSQGRWDPERQEWIH